MTAENDTSFTSAPPSAGTEESTGIQTGLPPAGESSIPLPPIQTPPEEPITPQELAQEMGRLDWVLSVLVVALGFLLASIPVRNTDFFLHLAQGRLYAHGHWDFGTDPFSYTKTNYWTNTSWLYDLLLYGITTLLGGVDSALAGLCWSPSRAFSLPCWPGSCSKPAVLICRAGRPRCAQAWPWWS